MIENMYECYTLNNGVKIPCIGYGTYKATEGAGEKTISHAIKVGYRYFDTASFYGTEGDIAKAVKESNIPREEFFYATKVWKEEMGYEQTKEAFEKSLKNLQTNYLDLYLIHWPIPSFGYKGWKQLTVDTWRAMEELYKEGKIRAIGFSNFLPHHIENILDNCTIRPMVNQLEFHPGYTQEAAVNYCKENNIQVQAWSPIGRARMLNDPLLVELAEKYNVSSAQICLRFALQKQIIPLPKTTSIERMKENKNIFSFSISKEDMYRLDTMPQVGWSGEHPDRERIYF